MASNLETTKKAYELFKRGDISQPGHRVRAKEGRTDRCEAMICVLSSTTLSEIS